MHSFAIECDRSFRTAIILKSVDCCFFFFLFAQVTVGGKGVTAVRKEARDETDFGRIFVSQ